MVFGKQLFALVAASLFTVSSAFVIQKRDSNTFHAINYGIDQNDCPTLSSIKQQLTTLKAYTTRIKTFTLTGCDEGNLIMQATQSLGLRIYLGLWVGSDANAFEAEKNKLIELAHAYSFSNVDGIVVGSEALYRGDVSPETLAGYISDVKKSLSGAGVNVPVATADVYYKWDPAVVAQVDFLMMNAFPYWEGVTVDNAVSTLFNHYDHVQSLSTGKPVVIGETGWPTHGSSFEAAVASVPNQETYMKGVLCQVRQRNIKLCWFEGLDEAYKGSDVEGNWGFLDASGNPKSSSYSSIFQNPC
ncbi:unnamed protein product [Umbelopsis ramanniana]